VTNVGPRLATGLLIVTVGLLGIPAAGQEPGAGQDDGFYELEVEPPADQSPSDDDLGDAVSPPAESDWDDRPGADAPPPEEYERALGAWGAWGADAQFGRFWRPSVGGGWQPFFDGRWVWTNWGWTWLSSEPWSWTFHYGRWSLLPSWGWVWFPGSIWSPAWVRWNTFGGYVGWAPWGYWGSPAFNQYLFVRDHDFCAPYLGRRVVRHDRLPRQSLVHWRDHGGQPPPRATIERVGRHPVTVLGDRPAASLSPWDRNPGRLGRGWDGPLMLDRGGRDRRESRDVPP
jgi:hypothetical protein